MMEILYATLVLSCTFLTISAAFQAFYKRNVMLSDLDFTSNVLQHYDNVTGFHNCVKLCKTHYCMSFSVCEADRMCRLYSSVFTNTSGAISHPGARYFERWSDSCLRWRTPGNPPAATNTYRVWMTRYGPTSLMRSYLVVCDMLIDNGGWTVIQNRFDGSVSFGSHAWIQYATTFGSYAGEFWLGLVFQTNLLNDNKPCELRIDLEDWSGVRKYAKYSHVRVGSYGTQYQLGISGYSGTAGDSMGDLNGRKFSARDHDFDQSDTNCAEKKQAGWWFKNCSLSNLNGRYTEDNGTEDETAMTWWTFHNSYRPLKKSRIMFRLKN